ncbi:papilin-like isoform X2 [Uloborus diversus]|uniref:papilin-like isoform X2 n=1 Tax=Uloborus diversus TaxID=327109 RepID=UPI00240A0F6F|nr:papilin-like isoform X2 [Uloborus diversus]
MPDEMCDEAKPLFTRACNDEIECPDWVTGEWSECDSNCGTGNRSRTLECRSKEGELMNDSLCIAGKKPVEFESCTQGPCEGVEWIVSDWSGCDGSCSPKMESREVHCANEDGVVFPNEVCEQRKIPELSRPCPKSAMCEPMWHTSEWTECSVKCGHGVQSRVVFCGAWQDDAVIKIEDKKCDPEKKFEEVQNCSSASCKGIWFTGPWNRCSVPCGGGERSRKILCFHEDEVVDTSQCDPSEEPFDKEICNMMPCDGDEVMVLSGCKDSKYGCCPDGMTEAGPSDEGCPKINVTSTNTTCEEAEFGCCADNFTLALGPFRKGCPSAINCNSTEYGCCPNEQTPAKGPNFEGCIVDDSNCTKSAFGCCPDGITEAGGPELEGCVLEDSNCTNSTFGCCPDGITEAIGPDSEGCPETEVNCSTTIFGCCPDGITPVSAFDSVGCENRTVNTSVDLGSGEDCYSDTFGCCPDGLTAALGPDQEGCEDRGNDTDCKSSAFGCCDDGITSAIGPFKEGCIEDGSGDGEMGVSCTESLFGCCPDNITLSKGFDNEGCPNCLNSTFGCCPDNITIALGPDDEGCFEVSCSNSTFGCCSDNVTLALGPEGEGCGPKDCNSSTFGCCPDNITLALGPDLAGCGLEDCANSTFGCCPDNITAALGLELAGCGFEDCSNSTFGCCPDNQTIALGPEGEGCFATECANSTFGCCSDNKTLALGPDYEGCDIMPCENTTFGCCPDNVTTALSLELDGCNETTNVTIAPEISTTPEIVHECVNTTFGCCPDEETQALGPNLEGCCFGMRFGCCPDNKTAALGPTYLGCGCQTFPYGCCPDAITPAQGFNYQGCKCEHMRFGCCQDQITPAKGPSFEGCLCYLMPYGCCPDGITPVINANGDGCGCDSTKYGCCPDGKTAAVSADLSGCPCETLPHGCCPDGHTPARTSDLKDCPCEAQRYGCCLDGRTIARGPNYEGCPCESTRFGCCLDGKTAATSPDHQGCPCETTRYGCCADGYTSASGPSYEGCPDVVKPKPKVSTEVCSLPKEIGPCPNFTVKWFFDISYGACSRFWYGGCKSNGNNFDTVEECENICVKPEGPEVCLLPKVPGSCDGKVPSWYYDAGSKTCEAFTYSGCLGNNNRFVSKQACESKCISKQPTRPVSRCSLPKDEGSCDNTVIQWYYNTEVGRCAQFYYGGCEGNSNRFSSRLECERSCTSAVTDETDICRLPKDGGPCNEFREQWYFDYESEQCHRFIYGGCKGNANKFGSFYECQKKCGKETVPEIPDEQEFKLEYCFESQDPGPCSNAEVNWYYDSNDGVCKEFYYGGCKGNGNRFKVRKECEDSCFKAQDVCSLAPVKGPCSGTFTQWFYDKSKDECFEFVFSGCQGNANRFNTKESCYAKCKKEPLTTVAPIVPDDICTLPQEPGPCLGYYRMWYYDSAENICKGFVYGGCDGNANRFGKRIECEKQCARKKISKEPPVFPTNVTSNEDVCRLPVDTGPCKETHPRWFYDAQSQSCLPFVFGGCGGNKNRFKSSEICLRFCTGIKAKPTVDEPTKAPIIPEVPLGCAPSNCDNIQCPFGIEEIFEGKCTRCRCSNPCEVHECSPGSRCAIDIVRTSRGEGVRTEPVCRRIRKPGTCPSSNALSSGRNDCETRCRDDADCRGEHKCCNNGCAFNCMPPSDELLEPAIQPAPLPLSAKVELITRQPTAGLSLQIDCLIEGPTSDMTVTWLHNDNVVLSNDRKRILSNHTLLIPKAEVADSGQYRCSAAYHGNVASSAITLTVNAAATDSSCVDSPHFGNCALIVKVGYCNNESYRRFCCGSCLRAEQQDT